MNRGAWQKKTVKRRVRAKGFTGRGKYTLSPRITASFDPEDFRVLTAFAHDKQRSVADILRDALFAYLLPVRADYPATNDKESDNGNSAKDQESRPSGRRSHSKRSPGRKDDQGRSGKASASFGDQQRQGAIGA